MFDLSGKTALITGASGGIGSAIAKTFYNSGARLVISGTNDKKLDDLRSQVPKNTEIIKCDLGNNEELMNLSGIFSEKNIDILVCNAGIIRDSLSIRMGENAWDEVMNINLRASFILNKAAVSSMMRRKWGRIINISSIVGFTGAAGQANYSASKAGLVAMTKSMALESASRGITCNCIAPGFVETEMTSGVLEKHRDGIISKIPVGFLGAAEDISPAALFLASEESRYMTGTTIHVNGGMLTQ